MHDVFLQRHQRVVRPRQLLHERDVERLDEAHVGDGRVELLRPQRAPAPASNQRPAARCGARCAPWTRDALVLCRTGGSPALARSPRPARYRAGSAPPPVPSSWNAVYSICRHSFSSDGAITTRFGMQRRYDEVECTVVRRAVGADQAAAVEREHDRQVLQRDVVNQLVVAALQEGRIDRDHRLHAVACQAGGEGHRVLLGDADVEIAIRETPARTRPAPSLRASPA